MTITQFKHSHIHSFIQKQKQNHITSKRFNKHQKKNKKINTTDKAKKQKETYIFTSQTSKDSNYFKKSQITIQINQQKKNSIINYYLISHSQKNKK